MFNIISNIWVYYPVFAFYRPDFRCRSSIEEYCATNKCLFNSSQALAPDPLINHNQCSRIDFNMSSISKCIRFNEENDSALNDSEMLMTHDDFVDCLSRELKNKVDCSFFIYNRTGIQSYNDDKFESMVLFPLCGTLIPVVLL